MFIRNAQEKDVFIPVEPFIKHADVAVPRFADVGIAGGGAGIVKNLAAGGLSLIHISEPTRPY